MREWGTSWSCPDELMSHIVGMWCHGQQRDSVWQSKGHQISVHWECKSERMKLPQALFSYTKKLMTSFLTVHSSPAAEAVSKSAQVCVVSENMIHGRGQSLALSWQLLKIVFHWRTHSTHLCWSLLWWHCKTLYSRTAAIREPETLSQILNKLGSHSLLRIQICFLHTASIKKKKKVQMMQNKIKNITIQWSGAWEVTM